MLSWSPSQPITQPYFPGPSSAYPGSDPGWLGHDSSRVPPAPAALSQACSLPLTKQLLFAPFAASPITGIRSSILVATHVCISTNGTRGAYVPARTGFRTSLRTGAPAPVRAGCAHVSMFTHIIECMHALTRCATHPDPPAPSQPAVPLDDRTYDSARAPVAPVEQYSSHPMRPEYLSRSYDQHHRPVRREKG